MHIEQRCVGRKWFDIEQIVNGIDHVGIVRPELIRQIAVADGHDVDTIGGRPIVDNRFVSAVDATDIGKLGFRQERPPAGELAILHRAIPIDEFKIVDLVILKQRLLGRQGLRCA